MSRDDLLSQAPRTAPEPETAEERTRRVGKRGLAGGVAAGGVAAAKFGGLKLVLWFFALRGTLDVLHVGVWVAFAVLAGGLGLVLALRARAER